jgi:hypothetical protein
MPAAGEGDIGPFWRVFPWDAAAAPGDPYTPQYVLPVGVQTGGRFDLSGVPTQYIALEDPAHALAEVLQPLRGRRELRAGHLRRRVRGQPGVRHPLAIVETWIPRALYDSLPDLGDPENLVTFGIRPDDLSSRDRATTQQSPASCTTTSTCPASDGGPPSEGSGTSRCCTWTAWTPFGSGTARPTPSTSHTRWCSPRRKN